MNRPLFGDNLKWLRDTKIFPDASVDLVYLDPPFNSNADYNVLFREASGEADGFNLDWTIRKFYSTNLKTMHRPTAAMHRFSSAPGRHLNFRA
jgi:hypothetical protein